MATSTNVIRTLTIRSQTEGVSQATAQLQGLAAAGDTVAESSVSQEKATLSVERAYQRLQRQLDQTVKSQELMAKAAQTLERAQAQGLTTQERANELMSMAAAQYQKTATAASSMTKAMSESTMANTNLLRGMSAAGAVAKEANDNLSKTAKSTEQVGNAGKAARYELINFNRQIQDVVVSLASGQNPFTVFIQQGSQLSDVALTSGKSLGSLAMGVLGMFSPLTLLVGGIGAVVAGFVLMSKVWSDMAIQADNLSKRLGAPIAQLQELQGAAAIKGISTDDFVKGMESFGDSISQAKKGLGDMKELFRLNGQSISQDMLPNFMKVADLVQNAKTEIDKLNVLQAAGLPRTQDWVRLMEQGGEAVRKAAQEMGNANVSQDMVDSARKFQEAWDKAWAQFKTAAFAVIGEVLELLGKLATAAGGLLDKAGAAVKGVLGSARTRADELAAGGSIEDQTVGPTQGGPLKLTVRPAVPTITPQDLAAMEHQISLEKQRIGLLGDLATSQQKAALADKEINLARLKGVDISKDEQAAIVKNIELDLKHSAKLKELKTDYKQIESAVSSFANTFIDSMLNGATATEALGKSLEGLGKQLIGIATQDFAKSISGSISQLIGGAAGMFGGPLATAAVGIGVSLLGKLFGGGDDKAEQQKAAQAAAQAEQQRLAREKQIADAQMRAAEFNLRAADAMEKSDFIKKLRDFDFESQKAFDAESKAAGDLAIWQLVAARAAERTKLIADTVEAATNTLAGTELSDVQKRMKEIADAAAELTLALQAQGLSTEEVAAAVNDKLNPAMDKLRGSFLDDLTRQVNELAGGDWINQADDLAKKVAQMRDDAAALGIQTALIEEFYIRSAASIAESNKLTGDSLAALESQLGLAPGSLNAFANAVQNTAAVAQRSADQLASASAALSLRLVQATNDTSQLSGALAVFDAQAGQQRAAEIAAGGQLLAQLDQTLAAERLQIQQRFADQALQQQQQAAQQALQAQQAAADAQKRIFDEAVNFLKAETNKIADYIAHLLSGTGSPLSPSARLAAAQSQFNTQRTLALGGNRDALSGITGNAQDLIDAAKSYYGSSAAFQAILSTTISQLQALPTQVSAEQFIVNAIEDQTTELAQRLVDGFDSIDTNTDGLITFDEMKLALGSMYTDSNLHDMFTRLDTDNSGSITRLEAISGATQGTNSSASSIANSTASSASSGFTVSSNTGSIDSKSSNLSPISTSTSSAASSLATQTATLASIDSAVGFLSSINNNIIQTNQHTLDTATATQAIQNSNAVIASWQSGQNHATGGWITGGTRGRDSVHGMLTPGEFVVREPIARGNPWLADFNQTGQFPSYANDNGGVVAAIRRMERSILLGIQALIQTELQTAGVIAKPIEEANKLTRSRRGEKKKAA